MQGMTLRSEAFPVPVQLEASSHAPGTFLRFEFSCAEQMLVWAERLVADLRETVAEGPFRTHGLK